MRRDKVISKGRKKARAASIFVAVTVFAVLIYKNVAPFGATIIYKIDLDEGSENITIPTPLTPSTLLGRNGKGTYYRIRQQKMLTDQVAFDLKVPYARWDKVEVKIRYQGDPEELLVGFNDPAIRDPANGHYAVKPIHNKSLNSLDWSRVESNHLTLFQWKRRFANINDFIANSGISLHNKDTAKQNIATYYYEFSQQPKIETGKANDGAEVDASLRGSHIFYVYLKGVPLEFSFTKQDINWYEGADPLNVGVYSGARLVHSQSVPDDGDAASSYKTFKSQKIKVHVPNLKEGVCKVVLDCGMDVVIKGLKSRQKYLSFEGKLFLADHELYRMEATRASTLYTNAKKLDAISWHKPALQTLQINNRQSLVLNKQNKSFSLSLTRGKSKIVTEKGDIILSSEGGYFAFSEDSLFDPVPFKTVPYSKDLLPYNIDYIMAGYTVPKRKGAWRTNSVILDLSGVKIKDNKLGFVLSSPGLVQRGEEIVLGSVEITLTKPGLFDDN